MKQFYLIAAAVIGFSASGLAQTMSPAGLLRPAKEFGPVNKKPMVKSQVSRSSMTERWYNYGEAMDKYWFNNAGTNSTLYGNNLFPDTTILVDYGASGYSGPWIHALGDVLDVSSQYFNDATSYPGEMNLSKTTPYRVDSIGMYFIYERFMSDPAIVDTLVFEVGVNNTTASLPTSGFLAPVASNLGTDTVWFKKPKYTQSTHSLNFSSKKVYKFPLDENFYLNPLPDSSYFAGVATANLPNSSANSVVTVSVKFVPGYSWIANYDTLANKNGVFFLTYKEQDNNFPLYTKRDWNCSYIIPQDVRYNAAGTWNGSYIPSFAYMGSGPTYNYEHHQIYYKVTDQLTGEKELAEKGTALFQNQPNPFSKITAIRYNLAKAEDITLSIHDVTGRLIKTIAQENQAAGMHQVSFDASELNQGIYFYTLKTSDSSFTKRMIISE